MNTYILYSWGGRIKWADFSGCFLVDPACEREFLAVMPDARPLPVNTNIF